MVTVESVPYGHIMREALAPDKLVKGYEAKQYGKRVVLEINEDTYAIEGLTIQDQDLIMPAGTVAERDWRTVVAYNTRLERNRALWDAYATPVINGLVNAGAAILDLFTLGVFGFSSDKKADSRGKAGEAISKAYGYKLFDTKRMFYYMGIPKLTQTKTTGIAPGVAPGPAPRGPPFEGGGSLPSFHSTQSRSYPTDTSNTRLYQLYDDSPIMRKVA